MIVGDFLRALGQLGDGRFLRVMLLGVCLSLALLFGIYAMMIGLIDLFIPGHVKIPFVGEIGGITQLFGWGSLLLVLVASVFLMMPVASAFSALFLDRVADAVEDRHYPGLPATIGLGFGAMLLDTLGFFALLITVNLILLLLWTVTGPLMPLIAWGLNGYLLGREFFTLVAARHLGLEGARAMRRHFGLQVWLAGVLMAAPLAFPLVNLLVPVLGVATFTHMFHRLQNQPAGR